MKKLAPVVLALVAVVAFAAVASAQQPLEFTVTVKAEPIRGTPNDHFLTFSGPVQLPGVSLPAGTYIFSLVGSSVVQVSNVDRSEYYALFFTTPALRGAPTPGVEMTFVRARYFAPLRIDKWFLPNQTLGYEFQYETPAMGDR
jgi:hypothetical protein